MDAECDVVVIGGGIQGLLALEALRHRGYSSVLVTDGEIGEGQTIHSHGFLNTGFGMLGDAPIRASQEVVQPFLREHGIEPSGEWRMIPPPGFPAESAAAPLPDGFAATFSAAAIASPDRNFPKRRLVEDLARRLGDCILRGRASIGERHNDVRTVEVGTPSGNVERYAAGAVVAAAGCGTKTLLAELVGRTAQTDEIKHRRVHMICLRAPHGALPAISVVAMPIGLMLAAHDDGATVTWYVTPTEFGGPAFDDVPPDASSIEDPSMLARGFEALQHLYPALTDAEDVRVGSYAGYRQDVGDMPGSPMCEPLAGAEDIIVALPSGLVPAWTNTVRIVELVSAIAAPSGRHRAVAADGVRVAVSLAVEDRPGFAWRSIAEFERSVKAAAQTGTPPSM